MGQTTTSAHLHQPLHVSVQHTDTPSSKCHLFNPPAPSAPLAASTSPPPQSPPPRTRRPLRPAYRMAIWRQAWREGGEGGVGGDLGVWVLWEFGGGRCGVCV